MRRAPPDASERHTLGCSNAPGKHGARRGAGSCARGIGALIARRSDQRPRDRRHRSFERAVYRQRKRIERPVIRLEQCRRIATRYEKRAVDYLAMPTLAAVFLWL
jgi:transposase